ncbi:MAG: sugar ABC transporter permease [Rhizobiaceae bacterium]|nr:sugar ABC transporter permease [Rhizobiaceae bacterium]
MANGIAADGRTSGPGRHPSARKSDNWFKWLLVAPAAVLILAISIYPLLFSVWVLFVNYDFQIPGHAYVGLKNFTQVITDPVARYSLWVTVVLSTINVVLEFLLGLAMAMAMANTFRGRGVLISILIVPLFISPIIVGQVWVLMLHSPFGPTNYLLGLLLGQEVNIRWLTAFPWNFVALVLADMWQWTPFMFVILLAGLTSIPPHVYEAAELDGVGRWQTFWYITVPYIAPMMLLAVTFRLLDAIRLFDTIFIMTGGGPGTSTYSASYYLYTIGFTQFHLSRATAGAWIFMILTLLVVFFLVRRLLRAEVR